MAQTHSRGDDDGSRVSPEIVIEFLVSGAQSAHFGLPAEGRYTREAYNSICRRVAQECVRWALLEDTRRPIGCSSCTSPRSKGAETKSFRTTCLRRERASEENISALDCRRAPHASVYVEENAIQGKTWKPAKLTISAYVARCVLLAYVTRNMQIFSRKQTLHERKGGRINVAVLRACVEITGDIASQMRD